AVVGGPALAERASVALGERTEAPAATLARLEWLVARHRIADATALLERRLGALTAAAGPGAAADGRSEPLEEAVATFGAARYPGVAHSFAEEVLGTPIAPDERFRAAIRHA